MHMMSYFFYALQVLEYWAGRGMLQILYGFIFSSIGNFFLFIFLVPIASRFYVDLACTQSILLLNCWFSGEAH